MRWIVITLVVINAAYFIWQQQFMATPGVVASSSPAMDKALRLATDIGKNPAPNVSVVPEPAQPQGPPVNNAQQQASTPPPTKTDEPTEPKIVSPSIRACYSVGPFLQVNDVSNSAKIFAAVEGIATQQRAAAERTQAGYWVYVPPFDTLSAARAVLRDLQNREVRDVLVISEGAKANAISAGVYNAEAQAQERRDSIRAYGYRVEIDALFRTQPQYWLDVELMNTQIIPAELWQKVIMKFPDIKRTEQPCE